MAENMADMLAKLMNVQGPTAPGQLALPTGPMQLGAAQGLNLQPPMPQPTGIQGLFSRLGRDPSLSLALLNAGISMMQPTPPGQTHLGNFAQSVGKGAQTYIADSERRTKNQQEERKMQLLEDANVRQLRQEGRLDREEGRQAELFPLRKDAAKEQVALRKIQRQLTQRYGSEEAKLKLDAIRARIRASDASAEHYKSDKGYAGAIASEVQRVQARVPSLLATRPELVELAKINPELAKAKAEDIAWGEVGTAKVNPYTSLTQMVNALNATKGNIFAENDPDLNAAVESLNRALTRVGQQAQQVGPSVGGEGGQFPPAQGTLAPDRSTQGKSGYTLQQLVDHYSKSAERQGLNPNDPAVAQKIQADALKLFTDLEDQAQ